MVHDNIPHNAHNYLCVKYTADNGKKGEYKVYSMDLPHGTTRWYWQALGNGGEEDTAADATDAARDWIRNGTNMKRI